MVVAEINSPQTLRRGNRLFSTSATLQPAWASSRAADEPAGPAPMMSASQRMSQKHLAEGKNPALLADPGAILGPQHRQFQVAESSPNTRHRIMAGDVIAPPPKNQPSAPNRKSPPARPAARARTPHPRPHV